jgi:hypothetical protein
MSYIKPVLEVIAYFVMFFTFTGKPHVTEN